MKKITLFKTFIILTGMLLMSSGVKSQEIFSTIFNIGDNWDGGTMTGYNEKTYVDEGWYFHSTSAVRGTSGESYGGSDYSFRDRDVFTVYNTASVSGMSGFSMQLRDWMLGSGEQRDMEISFDGGSTWETVFTVNKDWFDEYQTYQEYIYLFEDGEQDFGAEEFRIKIRGGGDTNNGRINIGQFVALGEQTAVATPSFSPAANTYFEPIEVTITTSTSGAEIYYTLNGNDPTEDDMLFDTPINISEDVTVKARAFKEGLEPSSVASAEYSFMNLLLRKDFEDGSLTSGGWTVHDIIEGARSWEIDDFGGETFAKISDFNSDPPYPHSWYVSPEIDLSGTDVANLSFESLAAFRQGEALSVKLSVNYTGGDPTVADWTELDATLSAHTGSGYGNWTPSGDLDLSQYDSPAHIAFHYESDENNTGEWQINNILITSGDDVESSDATLSVFKVGGIDVLDLDGIVVSDPETSEGAVLYVEDFEGFAGIEVETNHPAASYEVTLNGQAVGEAQIVEEGDIIVVSVTAENQTGVRHYKLTAEQAEEPAPGNIICNGDFEEWTNELPDCWYGDKSSIPSGSVNQYSANPHTGSYAVQLVNTSGSHQRFTSQATTVSEGLSYEITFWVKGKGEIRTGLFDDRETGFGYATYNSYLNVDSDEWTEYTQLITAANNSDIAEFIFSVRNTDADKDHLQLDNVSIEVMSEGPVEVDNIADLRNGIIGGMYTLTSEAVLTFQQSYRNQKYIQDETAAIMIDDADDNITTSYDRYDGITGITGILGVYQQMLQFMVTKDPGPASSAGNTLTPEVRTLESLTADDQARLIRIENVTFQTSGTFSTGSSYNITSPHGDGVFYTEFFNADYIDGAIPGQAQDMNVIVGQSNEVIRVTARDLDDFDVHTRVQEILGAEIDIFPNPFTDNLHIAGGLEIERVSVINLSGQTIIETTPMLESTVLQTGDIREGLYLIRIEFADGTFITRKILKQ